RPASPANSSGPSRSTRPACPASPARTAGTARTADSSGPARPACAANSACSAGPPGPAGAAGAIGADPRLAAHAGAIVPVRPPGLHVVAHIADVDVVADIDGAVVDIAAPAAGTDRLAGPPSGIGRAPARIAGPDRRVDRAGSPVPVVVVPQRPDGDA